MTEKYLLDESLKKIDYYLRWAGIHLEKKEGKYYKIYMIFIINFIVFNMDLLGAICTFVIGAKNGGSLNALFYVAPCIAFGFLSNIKSLCCVIYSDILHKLIFTLRDLEMKEKRRPQSEAKRKIIQKETTFLHLILKVLSFFNWSLIVSFPLMPLSLTMLNYVQTKEVQLLLPLLVTYPFDQFDIRIWPFVYIKQIWSIMLVVIDISGPDLTFFICSTYIRIQFQLLAYEVKRLVAEEKVQNLSEDALFKAKFVDLVKWHQQLICSVDFMEVIYCKSTLFNFVSSSAIICLTGFNVTTIGDIPLIISFLSFLFMSVVQIYFLCFFGDMLMRASQEVSNAVYNSKWYWTDKKTAKMLFIVLSRAQKACKLTAHGYADLNLMAFTKIISTAWSYFALLQTVTTE